MIGFIFIYLSFDFIVVIICLQKYIFFMGFPNFRDDNSDLDDYSLSGKCADSQ